MSSFTRATREGHRVAVHARIGETNVRRKFARDLISQPDSAVQIVAIERDGVSVASTQVPLGTAAPVIFGASATNFIQSAVFNEDFTLNSATNPTVPGDVIEVFVSGGGALTPTPADGTLVPPDSLPLAAAPVTALIIGDGAQTVTLVRPEVARRGHAGLELDLSGLGPCFGPHPAAPKNLY